MKFLFVLLFLVLFFITFAKAVIGRQILAIDPVQKAILEKGYKAEFCQIDSHEVTDLNSAQLYLEKIPEDKLLSELSVLQKKQCLENTKKEIIMGDLEVFFHGNTANYEGEETIFILDNIMYRTSGYLFDYYADSKSGGIWKTHILNQEYKGLKFVFSNAFFVSNFGSEVASTADKVIPNTGFARFYNRDGTLGTMMIAYKGKVFALRRIIEEKKDVTLVDYQEDFKRVISQPRHSAFPDTDKDCGTENSFLVQPGPGTPYTTNHPALDCFIQAAKSCTKAKLTYSAILSFVGNASSTMYYSISKKSDNTCDLHNKQGALSFSAPSGIPSNQQKSSEDYMRKYYATLMGTEGNCVFTDPNDLAQVFEKWKNGSFSNTDFVKGKCSGKYWDAIGGNTTPTPTSTAMLTPLGTNAKADNFSVTVTKVVANPQTTGDAPSTGMQYLEVDVSVTNNGTTETALPGSFYYQSISGQEVTTADTFGTNAPGKNVQIVGKESLVADFLQPGKKDVAKALIFQIPKGDKGKMIWHQDIFSTISPILAIFALF